LLIFYMIHSVPIIVTLRKRLDCLKNRKIRVTGGKILKKLWMCPVCWSNLLRKQTDVSWRISLGTLKSATMNIGIVVFNCVWFIIALVFPLCVTHGLTAIHFPSAKYFGTHLKFSTPENVVAQRLYVICSCSSICIIVVVYIVWC
jgi:hypothetical protein